MTSTKFTGPPLGPRRKPLGRNRSFVAMNFESRALLRRISGIKTRRQSRSKSSRKLRRHHSTLFRSPEKSMPRPVFAHAFVRAALQLFTARHGKK